MAAGLRALDDQCVGPAAGGDRGLFDIGHRHPHSNAGASQPVDGRLARAPERE